MDQIFHTAAVALTEEKRARELTEGFESLVLPAARFGQLKSSSDRRQWGMGALKERKSSARMPVQYDPAATSVASKWPTRVPLSTKRLLACG